MTTSSVEVKYNGSGAVENPVRTPVPLTSLAEGRKDKVNDGADDDNSMERMEVCALDAESGKWSCHPYKRDVFGDQIQQAKANGTSKYDATLDSLAKLGVQVYVVEGSSDDILGDILQFVHQVAKENQRSATASDPRTHQRCMLYQDAERRLFNLVLQPQAVGPASDYASMLESFSGAQAMVALVVLCRSFSCAFEDEIGQLKPALLSLILGLVLNVEISLSWVNTSMLVRAMPSISAFTLTSKLESDWIRKLMVLILAMAGAATGYTQKYMTLLGVTVACWILLANLGSRAWYFLKWKPLGYNGPFATLLAYIGAVLTGLFLPYMGHREIEAGGKRALEAVVISALIVASFFCISDIDEVQRFLVVGSDSCPQDNVNMIIGTWWMFTLFTSVMLVLKIQPYRLRPKDDEPFLVHDSASPVGYKVPNLPDYIVDPVLLQLDRFPCPLQWEVLISLVLGIGIGGGMLYLAFTGWDNIIPTR